MHSNPIPPKKFSLSNHHSVVHISHHFSRHVMLHLIVYLVYS